MAHNVIYFWFQINCGHKQILIFYRGYNIVPQILDFIRIQSDNFSFVINTNQDIASIMI